METRSALGSRAIVQVIIIVIVGQGKKDRRNYHIPLELHGSLHEEEESQLFPFCLRRRRVHRRLSILCYATGVI
ncbi:hypothetical protein BDZ85DRAFT_269102 [Elsinoe ampelina]|uniref:Uncharacterized protein n=1 Tax=Elsinoe ampelina TaxID=302913 RepID=A0A6A6G0Q4_9PEZI|nr:hypothetical protein BDZ85DRAFT_269102 [Elsinoe ampelina]